MAVGEVREGGRTFFVALEGFRGLAALLVMAFHFAMMLDVERGTAASLPHAELAVDFFFVLSGFVIAHAYESGLLVGGSLGRFALRRVLRLMPLLVAGALIGLGAILLQSLLGQPHLNRTLAACSFLFSILFLPTPPGLAPLTGKLFALDIPAWSLSLELLTNIGYAAVVRP